MIEEDLDVTMKIIVVGNGGVGKTSLISRFAKGNYISDYKKTLGVDFLERRMVVTGSSEEVTFFLWDTAGQEEYDAITRGYYKGATAAIIAFSTTDRASFNSVESWYNKVREECGSITIVLVQNKVDLIDQAVVTNQEVESLATRLHLRLYRVCVKDGFNIGEIFDYLATTYLNKKKTSASSPPQLANIKQMSTGSVPDATPTINLGKRPPGQKPPAHLFTSC
jgi:Ras-related protein Rab-23